MDNKDQNQQETPEMNESRMTFFGLALVQSCGMLCREIQKFNFFEKPFGSDAAKGAVVMAAHSCFQIAMSLGIEKTDFFTQISDYNEKQMGTDDGKKD